MKLLITGGTGFIGSALTRKLVEQNHDVTVLSRNPDSVATLCGPHVKAFGNLKQNDRDAQFDVIINLAGAPIFGAPWTTARKKILRASRIELTEQLLTFIDQQKIKPGLLISGSATGYYGNQGDTVLTEQSAPVTDFSHELCADWETAARQAEQHGVRVCIIRTGLVIGPGGLLQRLLLPFKLGLGGRLGSGKQWMSWIHRQDWINLAMAMIADGSMRGTYNATAPNPVRNAEFTDALARCLKRPALLPVPGWLLKTGLGEMSQLLLGSQRVIPERLLAQGFLFEYNDLEPALRQAIYTERNF
ncbi:MAG: TIGR01777 family protein [Methylococcaceae bacterium]|nr:TIGR01777 family protein [Methylococcaceae bacterium]